MEKIMVIVFENEKKAHQGVRALRKLDDDGSIAIHAGALIRKDQDGMINTVDDEEMNDFPIRTLGGTAAGGLIGILAGPAGFVAGSAIGAIAGMAGDLTVATLDEDLLDEISKQLIPGTTAAVLDVSEEWITPVDADLESYSKAIFRRPRVDVDDELTSRRIQASQKEMDALEAELKQAREDRKAKIHARMDELKARTRSQVEHLKQRREQLQNQSELKVKALQKKISNGSTEAKKSAQSRLEDLKKGDQKFFGQIEQSLGALQKADLDFTARVDSSIARGLRNAAEQIERRKPA